ncbi:MAG TPA: hypothetical protein VFU11_12685 [Solirubrobacterales bacterium]|nr:hypothetical protein [Solirubrobacterales bacterium]
MNSRYSQFADVSAVLAGGGFEVEEREFDGLGSVVIAETPLALVMAIELPVEDWVPLLEDAQARLTTLAAAHPSPRSWDLYLVLIHDGSEQGHRVRAAYEADTRYTRKLFVTGDRESIERSLRCLLPLHPLPEIKLVDSLAAVREKLLAAGVEPRVADAAIGSFADSSTVQIP